VQWRPSVPLDPGPGGEIRSVLKPKRLSNWGSALGGLTGAARQGKLSVRALTVLDSRSLVRTLFLASAVRFELIGHLGTDRSADELAELSGSRRPDRLRAWLQVGSTSGSCAGGETIPGGRTPGTCPGRWDEFLAAHYRSMLDYQVGPYAELDILLRGDP